MNCGARNPSRLLRCEKDDDPSDVIRLCDALERLSACMLSVTSRPASVFVKLDISVSTTPGATALTRPSKHFAAQIPN
jgi:hypothetical protein